MEMTAPEFLIYLMKYSTNHSELAKIGNRRGIGDCRETMYSFALFSESVFKVALFLMISLSSGPFPQSQFLKWSSSTESVFQAAPFHSPFPQSQFSSGYFPKSHFLSSAFPKSQFFKWRFFHSHIFTWRQWFFVKPSHSPTFPFSWHDDAFFVSWHELTSLKIT